MADNITLPGTGAIAETLDTFAASGVHSERQVVTLSPRDLSTGDSIGALTETAPATDTASSGLNGRLQRIAQRLTAALVDGANATFGVTTGVAVTTDATGTLQQYLRGLVKLIAAGTNVTITNANTNDSKAAANSAPVTASFEGVARAGIITETAPASDTASSGLNGRLQRVAQRISSLITLLPPALGTGGGLKIDGSGTPVPVTATVAASQTIAVTNIGTFAVQDTITDAALVSPGTALGSIKQSMVAGSVTTAAPTYTTGQINPLSLDTTGALRVNVTAGGAGGGAVTNVGTFAVQDTVLDAALATPATALGTIKELMVGGSVTTSSPTYTTGQINPLSLDTTGALRVNVTAGGAGGGAVTNAGTFAVQAAAVLGAETTKVIGTVNVAASQTIATTNAGTFSVQPSAAATGGATNLHFFSVTSGPAAVAIKASAGTLYGVQAVNTGAAPIYLKLYNTAFGSVSVGTTVPLVTIPVPTTATTGSGIAIAFPVGIAFGTAISYTFTNLAADADATAVAVGTTLNVQFA